jgi:two-component system invasion response regulator UvrY
VRVLIVDDHAVLRRGVRELLFEAHPAATVCEVDNCEDAIAEVGRTSWDVVILDLSLGGHDGFDVLRACREQVVVVLSAYEEEHYALRALRGGARGYVTKRCAAVELIAAVRKALAGGRYLSTTIAEQMAPRQVELSDREDQVLVMFGAGLSVQQIGAELGLSEDTIVVERARLLEKLGLRTTAQLIRYATSQLVD